MKLIPQPQRLVYQDGGAYYLDDTCRITLDISCDVQMHSYAKELSDWIQEHTGVHLMTDRRSLPAHRGILLRMTEKAEAKKESYQIIIDEKMAVIEASEASGLFYGVQTMKQIVRQCGLVLPQLTIEDWSDLPVRGWMLDVTRGRIPKLSYLKTMVDRCSFYKINQLHLYIEHTFLFDGFSEVWRDDTPLTAEDILELDAYCAQKHVDLVPSIATFGHLYKVLRTKTYRELSEMQEDGKIPFSFFHRMRHHTLNVTHEDALALVLRMIDEYAPLFRSKLFNINCDETFDLGKGGGKKLADEIGVHNMYIGWVKKVCEHLQSLGRRPMFWGDIIAAHPETIRDLPEDIICMTWDYGLAPGDDNVRALWENGAHQYLCPGVQGWHQTIHLIDIAYANIKKMTVFAHKFEGEGVLVTDWGDYGFFQLPETCMFGLIYTAAMGWNKQIEEESELNEAISRLEYQDATGKLGECLRTMSKQAVMHWGELVEYMEEYLYTITGKGMEKFWEDYMPRMQHRLAYIPEYNAQIDASCREFSAILTGVSPESKKRLAPVLMMARGQKLINEVLAYLTNVWCGRQHPYELRDTWELAEELETWYAAYRAEWRKTSRESELYRIGEVIFALADSLRDGVKAAESGR